MKRNVSLIMLIVIWILFPFTSMAASVGTFTFVKGDVDVTEPGMPAVKVFEGDEVYVGDIIRTKSDSKAEIQLADGSILRIAQKSRLEITEYMIDQGNLNGKMNLFRGKVQNIVKKAAGKTFGNKLENRFEVHTPTAVCGVRGTNFFTYYQNGVSGAIFKEGQGYGYNKNRPDQVKMIRAGQAMVVAGADEIPVIRPATDAEMEQHSDDTAVEEGEAESGDSDDSSSDDSSSDDSSSDDGSSDDGSSDDGSSDDGSSDDGSSDDGSSDDGSSDDGSSDTGTSDTGSADTGTTDTGTTDTGTTDTGTTDTGTTDTGTTDTGTTDLGTDDLGIGDLGTGDLGTGDLGTGDLTSPINDFTDPIDNLIPPDVTTTITTTSFTVPMNASAFGTDSTASLSVEIDDTTDTGTLTLSGASTVSGFPSASGDTWETVLTPEESGVETEGYFVGITGSLEALLATIYVDAGEIGFLTGSLSGDYLMDETTGDVVFEATGPISRQNVGAMSLPEFAMTESLFTLPIIGNIDAGGEIAPGYVRSQSASEVQNGNTILGVWSARTEQGTYSNINAVAAWNSHYALKNTDTFYMLGYVDVTDDLAGHVTVSADSITYMDSLYYGNYTLDYRGVYDPSTFSYSSAGAGTFILNPLAYSGAWGESIQAPNCLYDDAGGYMQTVGDEIGLIGGLTAPWDNPTSTLYAMGEFFDFGYGTGPLLWNSPITGNDVATPQNRFSGFTGGFWNAAATDTASGSMSGMARAIYMDSSGNAGILYTDNIAGFHYSDSTSWSAAGTWNRTFIETVSDPLNYVTYDGVLVGNLYGDLQDFGSIYGSTYQGTIRSFVSTLDYSPLTWGVYDLQLGNGNTWYGTMGSSWSAQIGGTGEFGYDGYWLASVNANVGTDGAMTGSLIGKYISETQMGTIQGPFHGLLTEIEPGYGSWIGQSLGTFEGQPLAFSSSFYDVDTFQMVPGTITEAELVIPDMYYNYGDSYRYEYEYFLSNSGVLLAGEKFFKDNIYNYEEGEIYLPDGRSAWTADVIPPYISVSSWAVGSLTEYDFSSPPDYGGWEYRWIEEWDTFCMASSGMISGTLGGTNSFWNATAASPAAMTLMGTYQPIVETWYDNGSAFRTRLASSDITDGAYYGYMSGIISNGIRGITNAIYVDPSRQAGILTGAFSGTLTGAYSGDLASSLNMWEATGSMYPRVMVADSGITPELLPESLQQGVMAGQIVGNFGSADSYLYGAIGWGDTVSIQGFDEFGIFEMMFGYDNQYVNPQQSTTWVAKAGGFGAFGSFESDYGDSMAGYEPDSGYWIMPLITGTSTDGIVSGNGTGTYLTLTQYGDVSAAFLGIYDANGSWQAVSSGNWENSQALAFNGIVHGDHMQTTEMMYGHWDNGAADYILSYDYGYDTSTGYGWSKAYDAMTGTTIQTDYHPDGTYEYWINGEVLTSGTGTYSGELLDYLMASNPFSIDIIEASSSYEFRHTGWTGGLLGGFGDLWSASAQSPSQLVFLGDYGLDYDRASLSSVFSLTVNSYNPYYDNCTIWDQTDPANPIDGNGSYYGYIDGLVYNATQIDGDLHALYLDKSGNVGILLGSIAGEGSPGIEMWKGQGSMYPIQLIQSTGLQASNLFDEWGEGYIRESIGEGPVELYGTFFDYSNPTYPDYGGPIYVNWIRNSYASIQGSIGATPWLVGISSELLGGSYGENYNGIINSTTFDHWAIDVYSQSGTLNSWGYLFSTPDSLQTTGQWSSGAISGKGCAGWVDLETAITGVAGADVKGTFNPANLTWQMAASWVSLDTNTFIALAGTQAGRDKLSQLNIPCVEIGRDTLTGTNGNINMALNDVTFFAYSTGADPRVWATDSVLGTFTQTPTTGEYVSLTGTNIYGSFTAGNFSNNQWDANVYGGGTLNRTDIAGSVYVNFDGAAAGTFTQDPASGSGSFSGTGSGAVMMQSQGY